jgi:hypothetical protein
VFSTYFITGAEMLHEDDFLSLLSQLPSSFLASHTSGAMHSANLLKDALQVQ